MLEFNKNLPPGNDSTGLFWTNKGQGRVTDCLEVSRGLSQTSGVLGIKS